MLSFNIIHMLESDPEEAVVIRRLFAVGNVVPSMAKAVNLPRASHWQACQCLRAASGIWHCDVCCSTLPSFCERLLASLLFQYCKECRCLPNVNLEFAVGPQFAGSASGTTPNKFQNHDSGVRESSGVAISCTFTCPRMQRTSLPAMIHTTHALAQH